MIPLSPLSGVGVGRRPKAALRASGEVMNPNNGPIAKATAAVTGTAEVLTGGLIPNAGPITAAGRTIRREFSAVGNALGFGKKAPNVQHSPYFIVTPGGTAVPVPTGAEGPIPTDAAGMQFTDGTGGAWNG